MLLANLVVSGLLKVPLFCRLRSHISASTLAGEGGGWVGGVGGEWANDVHNNFLNATDSTSSCWTPWCCWTGPRM